MIFSSQIELSCCNTSQEISFRHAEAPILPSHVFRKTIECPNCSSIVIITMIQSELGPLFRQEVIRL